MVQEKSLAKSALMPLLMIWLAVHAALLGLVLGIKFLTAKTLVLALLVTGSLAFLLSRFRVKPRKLSHSP